MKWKREIPGKLHTSGDYELVRLVRRWGVYYRGKHFDTVHTLGTAKWLAEFHFEGVHESRLEESGNAMCGGAL
jgi:hypothetical protein